MAGVRIVTDSACDLPADVVEQLGIEVVPLTIRFGDEEFVDREELSASDFYTKMASSPHLPETAAPSPGRFEQAFQRLADDGASANVCNKHTAQLSATKQSAQTAAKALEGGPVEVRVVDSTTISGPLGNIVSSAAAEAAEGRSVDEVLAGVADRAERTRLFATLDTLDNLKKGGRIGGAQALVGTLLSIKPLIEVSSGKVEEAGKQRTRRKAFAWLRDKLFEHGEVDQLTVCHGEAPDVDEMIELLSPRYDREQLGLTTIGAVIGAHGGPRVVGLAWQNRAGTD